MAFIVCASVTRVGLYVVRIGAAERYEGVLAHMARLVLHLRARRLPGVLNNS